MVAAYFTGDFTGVSAVVDPCSDRVGGADSADSGWKRPDTALRSNGGVGLLQDPESLDEFVGRFCRGLLM